MGSIFYSCFFRLATAAAQMTAYLIDSPRAGSESAWVPGYKDPGTEYVLGIDHSPTRHWGRWKAYTFPSRDPTYTTPLATVGDESTSSPVV